MQEDQKTPAQPDATIAALIAQFIRAMLEIFAVGRHGTALADLKRAEDDRNAAAEATIQSRYDGAWYRRKELRQRAAAHGVAFTPSASYEHQEAILDFLDDPLRPTPLTWGHTTWFYAVDEDGSPTASCTHPVNHAKYVWNANDLARMRPTGIADIDGAIARLRAKFPVDRCAWSADQWRTFEAGRQAHPVQDGERTTANRPGHSHAMPGNRGVPASL